MEDTDTIEYNSHDPSIEELTRDIAALANSEGGIIRIKEQLRDPVGDPRDTSAIQDKVGKAVTFLSSLTEIRVGTQVEMSQNTRFVNVYVAKSLTPLLVTHSRYYVRQGDTTIIAQEDLTMAFPQVASIANQTLKGNIERALPYLTEDNVDIGLFMLGREFENTLKQYLTRAYAKGKLTSTPGNKRPEELNLANMISCLKTNRIITDEAALSYLRQSRNDRVHGETPTLVDRRVQMNNVQLLANLYIEHIKLLDDLTRAL